MTVVRPTAPPMVKCPACGVQESAGKGQQGGNCASCGAAPPATKRYPPGTILGSYRLGDVLGEGGMGIVYVATHTRLDRRVAIKVLRSEYTNNAQALHRFFAEARAVNKIAHPNVIEITDFVEGPGDDNYYVMELLEGVSLAELVDTGGMLALPRSIAIMAQVAEAIAAVHRAGIVHRDLKPRNVLLIERSGQTDFVKLVDFGIAKLVGEDDVEPETVSFGTPRYMSPEQASSTAVDFRSDIYSFGVMLYEAVTGRPPFTGADVRELAVNVRTVASTPPRAIDGLPHEIPQPLEDLILACLAKDPSQRPDRIEQVAERLVAIADEHNWIVYELSLTPTPLPSSSGRHSKLAPEPVVADAADARGRRVWPLAVAGTVAVAITIAGVLLSSGRGSGGESRYASVAAARAKVQAELAIADQRIAAGRFVGRGGDEALDHLLAARALDPDDPGVRDRLGAIARKFEQLADQALAAGSLVEAAAHLQTVLVAEPDNQVAAKRMNEIEAEILSRQRAKPPRAR